MNLGKLPALMLTLALTFTSVVTSFAHHGWSRAVEGQHLEPGKSASSD